MRTVLQMIPLHCQKPINFLIFKHDNRKTKNQKEVQNFLNPVTIAIIAAVAAAVVFGVVGFVLGEVHRKKVAESAIGSATEEATRIVNQAVQTAENIRLSGIRGVCAEGKQLAVQDDKVMGFDTHMMVVPSGSGTAVVPLPHPFIGKMFGNLSSDVKIGFKGCAVKGSKAIHTQ